MSVEDLFREIAEASATKGGNHIKHGDYDMIVDKCILDKKEAGTCFIVELFVERSTKTGDNEPNAPGSRCSTVWNLTKHKSAKGNIKAFVLAMEGKDESNVSVDDAQVLIKESIGDKYRGQRIKCSTYKKMTKDGKTELVLPGWQNVPEQDVESGVALLNGTAKTEAGEGGMLGAVGL